MGEGLLQALLSDQGSGTRHSRGGNVLQGGSRREGSVPKTEQTHKRQLKIEMFKKKCYNDIQKCSFGDKNGTIKNSVTTEVETHIWQ